ncbi:MAG TPA: phosphotransferase [Candidatus Saccharimonadales bacterium]|nr:phosphotransferase [Candidatus Saccharimonadales bacterium]
MKSQATQAPAYILRAIRAYDLEPVHTLGVQKGYRNQSYGFRVASGRLYNFILFKQEPGMAKRIIRTHAVANFAAASGLPVRASISDRIIKLQDAQTARFGALYNYLPGETISWEAYTAKHIKLLGQALGELHSALARYPQAAALPSVAQEYVQIFNQMFIYFSQPATMQAVKNKLGIYLPVNTLYELKTFIAACDKLPGQQALHMDFVRSNILFSTRPRLRISGILDFEKTGCGAPMFDIARTLAFLLVDCKYKTEAQTHKYFLDSGYNKRSPVQVKQTFVRVKGIRHDLLETLINVFLLHDFYKFLRHNPYEYLAGNEHYARTKNLLLQRGILHQL